MLMEFISSNAGVITGVGGGGILLYILRAIPNDSICSVVETTFESVGRFMTLGLGKWKFSKKVWNSQIEPWFIDIIDNVFGSIVRGLIKGLRSDK